MATQLQPFLVGSRPVWKPIAAIPFVAGAPAADTKISKNGYAQKLRFRFVGTATVSAAGTAGTPNLKNVVASYILSLNGNFQYRSLDGESMILKSNLEVGGANDPVFNDPSYLNYNPASATAQTVYFEVTDCIALNDGINADEFLLAAQARNYDIILSLTFGSNASIVANTETMVLTGTLYVEAQYMLDPDYSKFAAPDLSYVQQIVTDTSFTNVSVGENVIPIVPLNGPEYMQLAFQPLFNGTIDTPGPTSALTRVLLRVNNSQDILDISAQDLYNENFRTWGRKLPFGYYVLDFLNDMLPLVNVMSPMRTRLLSTATLNQLELHCFVASGTTVTNSRIKLIKRLRNPAVTG